MACTEHASLLIDGERLPMDLSRARGLLEKACRQDDHAIACARLLSLLSSTQAGEEGQLNELESRLDRLSHEACRRGEAEACAMVVSGLQKKGASARDLERGEKLRERVDDAFLRGCRGGNAHACVRVSQKLSSGVQETLQGLCRKNDAKACSGLVSLGLKNKKGDEFFSWLEQSCRLDVVGDCLLGVSLTSQSSGGERLAWFFRQRAAALLGARCQANSVRACSSWLAQTLDAAWPSGREVVSEIAARERKLLDEACLQGDRWSCITLAERFAGGIGGLPVSAEKAIFYHEKGCSGGNPTLCTKKISAIGPVVSLATNDFGGCVADPSSLVRCWGPVAGKNDGALDALTPLDGPRMKTISLGPFHGCGLNEEGGLACWGQMTDASARQGEMPHSIPVEPLVAIASGTNFSCGLGRSGQVHCWGRAAFGALGEGARGPGPVALAGLKGVTSLDASGNVACAVVAGVVHCWGEFPSGDEAPGKLIKLAELGSDVVQVSLGAGLCAVRKQGSLVCLGEKLAGRTHEVKTIEGLPPVIQTSGREQVRCARTVQGDVWCWGPPREAPPGDRRWEVPFKVNGLVGAIDLHVGRNTVCARLDGGELRCWGKPLLLNSCTWPPHWFAEPQPVVVVPF